MISLEDVVDRPPVVHGGLSTWGISLRLARFLDAQLTPQSITLETGAGLSTILFLRRGVARHISIAPYEPEFTAIRTYCAKVGIDTSALEVVCAGSQRYLPTATLPPLDLVLIDGSHAFPAPFLDWFYTCEALKVGGLMVVDDLPLVTGAILADFLSADERWDEVLRDDRFAVYRKRVHPIADERDWMAQAYVVKSYPVAAVRVVRAGPLRRALILMKAAWTQPELVTRKLRSLRGRPRR
jgi:predicted O-methyltransferase YrrM